MSGAAFAAAALAIAAGLVAPGLLAVRFLSAPRGLLERLVLALALGRLILAGVTLALLAVGALRALPALAAVALAAAAVLAARDRRRDASNAGSRWTDAVPLAAALASTLVLVVAVVGRSGVIESSGDLAFRGTDAAYDPLFYVATATQLANAGLPLQNPYAAHFPIVGHYAFYASLVGLRAIGEALAPVLGADAVARLPFELGFRALPLLDVAALALAASALARVLGARTGGSAVAGGVAVLGGHLAPLANAGAAMLGFPVRDVLGWSLFGPFLLPVNPISAAAAGLLAALLLLARATPSAVAAPAVAGVLVGALAEQKLFFWAPALAGLLATAVWRPPAGLAQPLRIAALAALAVSMPSVAEKVLFARGPGAAFDVGFGVCAGCLPRYLLDVAYAGGDFGFGLFASFAARDLASPSYLLAAASASIAFLAIALGARLAAAPALWRAARSERDGSAGVARVLGFAALAGVAATIGLGAAPHYLNGGQFLWAAGFALAIGVGLACDAWLAAGRPSWAALLLALVLLGSARDVVVQGIGAPVGLRASAAERALMVELARASAFDDVVLEPSWLDDADRPSAVPWLAGRRVVLTTSAAAAYLPSWERLFRLQNVERVYTTEDRAEIVRAARAVGARFVYAPAHRPLRAPDGPGLLRIARNEAGAVYRVADEQGSP